jgi:hypothetical protein
MGFAGERRRAGICHSWWDRRLGTLKETTWVPGCSVLANGHSSQKSVDVWEGSRFRLLCIYGSAWFQQGRQEEEGESNYCLVSRSSKTALELTLHFDPPTLFCVCDWFDGVMHLHPMRCFGQLLARLQGIKRLLLVIRTARGAATTSSLPASASNKYCILRTAFGVLSRLS